MSKKVNSRYVDPLKFPRLNQDGSEKLSSKKVEAHVEFDEGQSVDAMYKKYLKRHALRYLDSHEDILDDPLAEELFVDEENMSSPFEEGESYVEPDPVARMKALKKFQAEKEIRERAAREKEIQEEVQKRTASISQKNSSKVEPE